MVITTKKVTIEYPVYFVDGVQTCCANVRGQCCRFLMTARMGTKQICTLGDDIGDVEVFYGENGFVKPHDRCELSKPVSLYELSNHSSIENEP